MVFDFSVTAGTEYAIAAFLLGIILGAVYDVFRIARLMLPQIKLLIFFADILFCMITTAGFLLVTFNYNDGELRVFALALMAVGFRLYYGTIGRLVYSLSEKIILLIKRVLKIIIKPLVLLCRLIDNTVRQAQIRLKMRRNIASAERGFGLI